MTSSSTFLTPKREHRVNTRSMPKRTDIRSILVIGAGPIVIGQGCEFDYSGTQACKALREEGYRVVLVNSNPATIMTDPEVADATYIEPITPEFVAQDHREGAAGRAAADDGRPDRAQHRDGARRERHAGRATACELIGANAEAIDKAEDRELFREAMIAHRPRHAEERHRALAGGGLARARGDRPAGDHPALLHARRHGRRHRLQPRGVRADRGLAASTRRRSARC